MKHKRTLQLFVATGIISLMTLPLQAQVTIGSGVEPVKGALLDLKETDKPDGSADATKGLLLPRVNLTNLTPTATTGTNSLPASIGHSASESWNLVAHTGLIVYNVKKSDRCAAIQIPTGVYTWTGTQWEFLGQQEALAPGVMYHPAKQNPDYIDAVTTPDEPQNIYEEFYSANFGAAGRWMTTNLTAWTYDSNVTSAILSATPSISNSSDRENPLWCYPSGGTGGSNATTYLANKKLGLLYNWLAATGKQNITTADQSEKTDGTDPTPRIQGICPEGWHLPSDKEWNDLEEEIYNFPQLYSSYADNSAFPIMPNGWRTATGYRQHENDGQGQAMKSPCYSSRQDGKSNTVQQNGFDAPLVGYATGGNATSGVKSGIIFQSSSSGNSSQVWIRLIGSFGGVSRERYSRGYLVSVRCKKD
jgi:uncharacterized protein (TIGR02145 family)